MALLKQAEAAVLTRDAIVLDLGDLRRQGTRLIEVARSEAARIQAEALAERSTIIDGADKVGYQQGFERGVEEGRAAGLEAGTRLALEQRAKELARVEAGWAEGLDRFLAERERFLAQGQRDVVLLAAAIASRIVKRTVEVDPGVVQAQVAEVLSLVLRPTRLAVACHPADRALVEAALPGLVARMQHSASVELVDEPGLERGSCVARLADGGGFIDASIGTQLDRIVAALVPGAGDGSGREGA